MKISDAKVVRQEPLTGGYNLLVLDVPSIASEVKPGQFVHLRIPRFGEAVLRRPFSVYKADQNIITILYKKVGKGTVILQDVRPGEVISLMGPLGNGFPVENDGKLPVLVAGGYGVAPLCLLAGKLSVKGIVFIGGRTSEDILCADDFRNDGWEVRIMTEDGSLGEQGLVTDGIKKWLDEKGSDFDAELFSCGPDGMLKAVGDLAISMGWKAWLSLDKHMGCGAGACLACVQRLRVDDGSERLGRVCKDGPVFEAREIVW